MKTKYVTRAIIAYILIISSSAFSQTRTQTAEEIIKNACLSKDSVLVIDEVGDDSINTKIIDLDGDGIYDVFHGDFVKKLVELNNQNVIVQSIGSPLLRNTNHKKPKVNPV